MTDQEIQDLIVSSKGGDQTAFEELVRQHQSYVFALAIRLLSDINEARDIAQESFIRVWRHLHRYDARMKFRTWLYTIVTNLAKDRLRALGREQKRFASPSAGSEPEDRAEERDLHDAVANSEIATVVVNLTRQLPARQQLVFTLRDLEDLTVAEVAEITGMTPGSIKTNLHFARAKIRALLLRLYHIDGC